MPLARKVLGHVQGVSLGITSGHEHLTSHHHSGLRDRDEWAGVFVERRVEVYCTNITHRSLRRCKSSSLLVCRHPGIRTPGMFYALRGDQIKQF